jgi:hypothetical protein
MQVTDNAGATDEHRALNYLVMRYPQYLRQSCGGICARLFAYTNRNTDFNLNQPKGDLE